jgi:hypothetical protein
MRRVLYFEHSMFLVVNILHKKDFLNSLKLKSINIF